MKEYVDPLDRALRFLREKGHAIGPVSRDVAFVDGKTYAILDVIALADKLHHEDWLASENALVDGILKPKAEAPALKDDAPNAEDFDLGDQGQSGG